MTPTDLPVKLFKTQDAWRKWLHTNHTKSPGIWMRIAKKNGDLSSVNYQEALDVALCYGWIDGQKRPNDASSWLQRFTPRGPRSLWSKINTAKADALIESGQMHASGLAAIEAAKASGRWESAYQPASSAAVPPELQAALDRNPKAKACFETLRAAIRYSIVFRVQTAKKPETKAKRVADFIARLESGDTSFGVPGKKA
ncbi:MAG TPA: YdeI/OmpD-associated family protein [Gemmatimonadaceae bacterium]|nr:YdeI/OmpD-associated family protein [Gemmatimonadaceae bacterium]